MGPRGTAFLDRRRPPCRTRHAAARELVRSRGRARQLLRAADAPRLVGAAPRHLAGLVLLGRRRAGAGAASTSSAWTRSTSTTSGWRTASAPGSDSSRRVGDRRDRRARRRRAARGGRNPRRDARRVATRVVPRLQHRGGRGRGARRPDLGGDGAGGGACATEVVEVRLPAGGNGVRREPDEQHRRGRRAAASGASSRPRASSRSPLRRLHGAHEVTTFSHTEPPPFERGTTWSSVSRPPVSPQ